MPIPDQTLDQYVRRANAEQIERAGKEFAAYQKTEPAYITSRIGPAFEAFYQTIQAEAQKAGLEKKLAPEQTKELLRKGLLAWINIARPEVATNLPKNPEEQHALLREEFDTYHGLTSPETVPLSLTILTKNLPNLQLDGNSLVHRFRAQHGQYISNAWQATLESKLGELQAPLREQGGKLKYAVTAAEQGGYAVERLPTFAHHMLKLDDKTFLAFAEAARQAKLPEDDLKSIGLKKSA